jgi:hypothetical protein
VKVRGVGREKGMGGGPWRICALEDFRGGNNSALRRGLPLGAIMGAIYDLMDKDSALGWLFKYRVGRIKWRIGLLIKSEAKVWDLVPADLAPCGQMCTRRSALNSPAECISIEAPLHVPSERDS